MIDGIEERHHGPSDAMHNPPNYSGFSQKKFVSFLTEYNTLLSTFSFRDIFTVTNGNPSSVIIKQHCGRSSKYCESNSSMLEGLTLTARNPVKEALIMNLPDHRLRRWSYDLIPA
ncbi:hypothetical protein Tco_0737084 [Tanacetum coccineum]